MAPPTRTQTKSKRLMGISEVRLGRRGATGPRRGLAGSSTPTHSHHEGVWVWLMRVDLTENEKLGGHSRRR